MKRNRQLLSFGAATLTLLVSIINTAFAQNKNLPDSTIKTMVEYKLIKSKVQNNHNIKVSVDDGIVTLRGTVASASERRKAEKIARDVDDDLRVENQLEVATSKRSDQQIADNVVREIRSFAFFDIFDWVEGNVQSGVVTLRGAVREPWRKNDYERLAESVEGVREVKNELRVLPLSPYDDQLRVAALRTIYGDQRFVRYANRALPPIHILVDGGRLYLKGAVANQLEKQLAEQLVRTMSFNFGGNISALEVVNDLVVDSAKD